MTALGNHYTISSNCTGSRYLGLDLDWDYEKRKVHLSMISYVQDALTQFHHSFPHKPQHQPYPHAKITYGDKSQYATADDNSQLLSPTGKKIIQEVTGTFLYYARAIDATMLPALVSLATQQAAPTENIMTLAKTFIEYPATHPDAIITYHTSDMVLSAHSDASTSQNQNQEAGPAAIFSCQTTHPFLQTTDSSSPYPKSSKQSCTLRRKRKWKLYSSTTRRTSLHVTPSRKWGTNSLPRICKPTTQPPTEW